MTNVRSTNDTKNVFEILLTADIVISKDNNIACKHSQDQTISIPLLSIHKILNSGLECLLIVSLYSIIFTPEIQRNYY